MGIGCEAQNAQRASNEGDWSSEGHAPTEYISLASTPIIRTSDQKMKPDTDPGSPSGGGLDANVDKTSKQSLSNKHLRNLTTSLTILCVTACLALGSCAYMSLCLQASASSNILEGLMFGAGMLSTLCGLGNPWFAPWIPVVFVIFVVCVISANPALNSLFVAVRVVFVVFVISVVFVKGDPQANHRFGKP